MAEKKMQLVDWLDDLCVRFIINLPHEELTSVERICFQIEEAQWFYEDFIRAQDPTMPQMNLKHFCELIFQHCPLLAPFSASAALSYAEFLAYKTRVPVRGAILLNEAMTEVVLVKGWNKKAKWSFPRGKINKEERDLDCAIREVYEETGYDVRGAGLVDENADNNKAIDMSLREQQMRLYVFRGVPMDTVFEPKTRKEISKIQWYKITDLANTGKGKEGPIADGMKSSQFYMVAPFIKPLRSWIKQQRNLNKQQRQRGVETEDEGLLAPHPMAYDEGMITTDAEDESHFQRLLSGLQKPLHTQPERDNLPEVTAPATTADLSAELKRMLSVGGPVIAPPQQATQDNPLLSLLRGQQQAPQQQGSYLPPQTPLEQITATPPQAHTPHHHHPKPPPYSEMPPPPVFPLSPAQIRHGPPQPHSHAPPMHWQGNPNPSPFYGQMPPPGPMHHAGPPPGPHQRGLFGSDVPAPPPPQIFNPLATGDPAFRSHFPQYNQAPPPLPIAKAPPQKLTNHALGLLNVFKSPNVQSAQPVAQTHQTPSQLPELAPTNDDRSLDPVLPSQLATGGVYLPDRVDSPPQMHQPQAQKPRSSHQASLLNLFRSAATPAVAASGLGPPSASEPVELSAQPSPHVAKEIINSMQNKLSMRRLSNMNSPPSATELQRPSPSIASHASATRGQTKLAGVDLTSATVSGPLNAPDFETVKKNQPQKPVEMGNGIISPSPQSIARFPPASQSIIPPATILQRPESGPRRPIATPPVPVHTVTNRTMMEAPRPFHPTSILRKSAQDIVEMAQAQNVNQNAPRPAQQQLPPQQDAHQFQNQSRTTQIPLGPAPSSVQHNTLPNFDRRGEAPQEQKNTLLSLFGGTGASSGPTTNASPPGGLTGSSNYPGSLPGPMPGTLTTSGLISSNPAGGHPVSALPAHGAASGIMSPVSPLPGSFSTTRRTDTDISLLNLNLNVGPTGAHAHAHHGSGDTPRSSRISSITSLQGSLHSLPGSLQGEMPLQQQHNGGTPGPTSAPSIPGQTFGFAGTPGGVSISLPGKPTPPIPGSGGKRGSFANEGPGGSGTQSPITPVEKNFLLGYLQGVVKEGGSRRGSGQGGGSMR